MAAVLIAFGILVVVYFTVTYFLFRLACRRFDKGRNPLHGIGDSLDKLTAPYDHILQPSLAWLRTQTPEPVEIESFDGLKLRADFFENPEARGILIACHGYRSSGFRDFAAACSFYNRHGFSILLIDERACGRSEGKYITFGVLERLDIQDWCRWAAERFPDKKLLLAGISMGATGVLLASADLPDSVSAILADCGFASAWDQLAYIVRHYVHLPAVPILRGVDFWCRVLGHFSLRQLTTEDALAFNTRPVLFLHGEADDFVPPEHSRRSFEACAAPKTLFTVPEAGHGMSFLVDFDGYSAAVDRFLRENGYDAPP